jgi:hypothetical protein
MSNDKINYGRAIILLYIPSFLVILSTLIEGTFITLPSSEGISLLQHPGNFSMLIIFPLIVISFINLIIRYHRFIFNINNLIDISKLKKENQAGKEYIETIIKKGYVKTKAFWVFFSTVTLICVSAVLLNIINTSSINLVIEKFGHNVYDSIDFIFGFLTMKLFFILFWFVIPSILLGKLYLIISSLNNVFRILRKSDALYMNPLHPDKSGGLGQLGEIALRLNYTVAIAFAMVIALYFSHGMTGTLMFGFIIVTLLMVIVFFFPLHEAHKAMKEAKIRLLSSLSQKYDSINKRFTDHILTSKTHEELFDNQGEEMFETHKKLSEIYEHILNLPTWPYDLNTISRFIGTLLIPVVVFFVDMITNTDSILWNFNKIFK